MSGNSNADIWIAGAFAAFTVDLLVYPLDTLKTRLQSPNYKARYTNGAANTVNKAALFRGLYQGVGSVILATLPSSGAFFTTYEGVKHVLSTHNPTLPGRETHLIAQPIIHATASALAELVSCAILTPAEVIKQNAQMVDASSPAGATAQTLRKFRGNPLALWRGYTALAGRNLPFTALQFPMFERLKSALFAYRDSNGTRTNTVLEGGVITAASAGAAGSVAAVLTTPVDVVKTRIMLAAADVTPRESTAGLVDAMGATAGTTQASRKNSIQIAREIVAENGVKGLWRGGALRAVWTFVGSGLYLGVYESGKTYLAHRRGERLREQDIL
ncbi:uncharacterized protein PV09_02395 [Verruconis gallopava]|uniref:Mitochondrial carrier protein n=1 Tax=Verruconis gallopava TaxID=253628 RepID=A0A0D2B630_9PEZI|nr:uncharacterized protein PV09_02395 [Verruconis gallopava]KIW06694.1 hypothetical protein PV09_02395 [Verruconis gallopava]